MKLDLQSPVDLVVGTPGTLLQFCEKGMDPFKVLTYKVYLPRFNPSLVIFLCISRHSEKLKYLKLPLNTYLNCLSDDE